MNIEFTPESWGDCLYWQKNDKKILRRINELLKDIQRNPSEGTGKPEPLRYQLQGCGSRRIDQEHRLVYEVEESVIRIIACRFHY